MQIYMSAPMKDATLEEQTKNRVLIKSELRKKGYDSVKVFNPYLYFNYQNEFHQSEKEVMRFELYNVKQSDILIYEETGIKSIGCSMEIATAFEYNIPIFILNENNLPLHPWIEEMSSRSFSSLNELIEYIEWYYLN